MAGMRGSELDRERTAGRLRAAYEHGYVSVWTLEHRLSRVSAARTVGELRTLVSDLPAHPGWERLKRLARREAAPWAVEVELPYSPDLPVVVGRSRSCDVVLRDPSVSRRHLELRMLDAGQFVAVDLGTTNGTWFLGRRTGRVVVGEGDELLLGACAIVLR
jgi:hypothetical protein